MPHRLWSEYILSNFILFTDAKPITVKTVNLLLLLLWKFSDVKSNKKSVTSKVLPFSLLYKVTLIAVRWSFLSTLSMMTDDIVYFKRLTIKKWKVSWINAFGMVEIPPYKFEIMIVDHSTSCASQRTSSFLPPVYRFEHEKNFLWSRSVIIKT